MLLAYLWLDRWEPEPPRLLVLAFLWGASVAVVVSVDPASWSSRRLLDPGAAAAGELVTIAHRRTR